MNKRPGSEKIQSIQILRAVAALLVVLVHSINVYDHWMLKQPSGNHLPSILGERWAINEFGASGVDLFFVISGFIMAVVIDPKSDAPSVKKFMVGRFKRIVPLFWVTTTLYTIYCIAIVEPFAWQQLVHNFTIIPVFADYPAPVLVVGWSLSFELTFYAAVAISLLAPHAQRMGILTSLVMVMAFCGIYFATPSAVFNSIFLEFALGLGVYILWRRYPQAEPLIASLCVAFGVTLLAWTLMNGFPFSATYQNIFANQSGAARTLFWALPWAWIVIGCLWLENHYHAWFERSQSKPYRALLYLGDASYSLYLVHFFVVITLVKIPVPIGINMDVMIVVAMAASVGLGIIWYEWIERPLIRSLTNRAVVSDGVSLPEREARQPHLPV